MGYCEALEAAGAEIEAYEEFGSYQGTWIAKVTFNGQSGFVFGDFGSCSGCDAFQSEFGYSDSKCKEHRYYSYDRIDEIQCSACVDAANAYTEDLAEFGKSYLDNIMTKEEAIAEIKGTYSHGYLSSEMDDQLKFVEE